MSIERTSDRFFIQLMEKNQEMLKESKSITLDDQEFDQLVNYI
jgi:hypothetical protein